LIGMD